MLFKIAHGCPNCGHEISDTRLAQGLPCETCLPELKNHPCQALEENRKLLGFEPFCRVEKELVRFQEAFEKALGLKPSSLQLSWAKRLFLGESFAIVAPTGTGKTTFGLLSLLLLPGKNLILVPTRLLCEQLAARLLEMAEKIGLQRSILAYRGRKKEKEAFLSGDYEILVATSAFMYKQAEEFQKASFSLVFVDDVDAFLKNSRHVETLFKILGFTEEELSLALKKGKTPEDYERLKIIRSRAGRGQLLLSSATLKPRGARLALFQNLLGFDIQRAVSSLRNITDTYEVLTRERLLQRATELIKVLGSGGLVFLSEEFGKDRVEDVTQFLRSQGIKAISYLEEKPEKLMARLRAGEFEVAVGLSHLSNPLVRGIDLPEILRYAVFVGVPKHVFPLKLEDTPARLQNLLSALLPLFENDDQLTALSYLRYLKSYFTLRAEDLHRYPRLAKRIREIRNFLEKHLNDPAFQERLKQSEEVFLEETDDGLRVVVGDAATYLQASGRVSRLSAGRVLPGLSLVLAEDSKAFVSLVHRLTFFLGEPPAFIPLSKLDLAEESRKLTEARKDTRKGQTLEVKSTLLVVESPHKARTIASFWGRPSQRRLGSLTVYEIPTENGLLMVTASLGHVFNLSRRRGIFGVQKADGAFVPIFDTIKRCRETGEELIDPEEVRERCPGEVLDKGEILSALSRLAFTVDEVFIGSDPDAEGEKIAYDLFITLRPFQRNIKRLEFHEVTPRALKEALSTPRDFNLPRVKAQLARRVADRWVGFTLSRYLWRVFSRRGLSAGRVQTPVLGWVIERAREASRRKYRLSFYLSGRRFDREFEDAKEARRAFEKLSTLKWHLLEFREETLQAPPPFTTDSVLEEAHARLGLSSRKTMELLQQLFESGLITYHRTDSTRVSEAGRFQVARPYIEKTLGAEYFRPRGWADSGAHEAIRPTRPWDTGELRSRVAHGLLHLEEERTAIRLYDLIFRRFMASQCRNTVVKKARLLFKAEDFKWEEEVPVEILVQGFEKFWDRIELFSPEGSAQPEKVTLSAISAVPLFTEGTLVQEMKRRGLGRPSTYAEIVSTLLHRHYVKPIKAGRLVPTHLGKEVYETLRQAFPHYVSEEFTRELETLMDRIEEGQSDWQEVCITLKELVKNEDPSSI
ncbi:reverse gyrase [Thermosulfurimonas dismutans]|uniref:Reverse gyrase n=1 Tax=Thermosulfurimonas dismutans TaxID=999894 RepID=A0A179D670_9BACT|nr:reverse gyrase [Thermosulfurimonas dismutans]OAQ20942.1 DNA reverse gyrase [Thermosulfurimonas dismutans]